MGIIVKGMDGARDKGGTERLVTNVNEKHRYKGFTKRKETLYEQKRH